MSRQPEIAPEIRGLLEEIVADPRSSIRFVPRRALREWFDRGETIRARDVDGTKAARHLIAAHREALACMLLEGAKIAYWKAPVLSHRPVGADGRPFDEREAEREWRHLAVRRATYTGLVGAETELLRQALSGISAESGHALAKASLSLVPCDDARYFVARTVPWNRPRTALSLFERLATRATSTLLPHILSSGAARLCCLGLIAGARKSYRAAATLDPASPLDRFCVFNLSCGLGEDKAALSAAEEIGPLVSESDPRVFEAMQLMTGWWREREERERIAAREVLARIKGSIPQVAVHLSEAFAS